MTTIRSIPIRPVASVAVTVPRATKTPAEAAQQEDHEYDDEYEPERHESFSLLVRAKDIRSVKASAA
jgi:hypothetical protein